MSRGEKATRKQSGEWSHVAKSHGIPGASRSWRRPGRILPRSLWRDRGPAGTLTSDLWPPEPGELMYVVFLARVVALCHGPSRETNTPPQGTAVTASIGHTAHRRCPVNDREHHCAACGPAGAQRVKRSIASVRGDTRPPWCPVSPHALLAACGWSLRRTEPEGEKTKRQLGRAAVG